MFFVLSKILSFLIRPITIIVACFVASLIIKNEKRKKKLRLAGIILLLFFSNQFIVNEVLLFWEIPPTPIKEINRTYKTGIILTGVLNLKKHPEDRAYFNKGADRVMHTVQLYKSGIIENILVTGGSGHLFDETLKEADVIKSVLLMSGVPEDKIIIENEARNTHENALFTTRILQERFPNDRHLLITSAFHMRRASLCFAKENLEFDTFSTDFYTHDRRFSHEELIIPNADALNKWNIIFKELLGIVAYKAAGYI
ncbi:MAG: YdcF family protein [Bacteroidota bacterium]